MSDKSDPAGTLPLPLDEKYIFVKRSSTSKPTLPLQTAGQRADCRGRSFQFSSRDFPKGDNFLDPLLIAASYAYLEFSYRTIPLRRIRFACRLTAGAKFGRYFRQEIRKPVTQGDHRQKEWSDSLDENRSVIHRRLRSSSALGAVWYRYRLRGLRLALRFLLFNGNE